MRKLKLTLTRAPQDYSVASTFPDAPRMIPRFRYVPDCRYTLRDGHGNMVASFCATQFHLATGYRLKPGEKQRVEIDIKAVA